MVAAAGPAAAAALANQPQLGMDQVVVVLAHQFQVGPKALLNVDPATFNRGGELGMLQLHLVAEIAFHLPRAMLVRSVQFGQAPQQLGFVDHQFVFPFLPPVDPVVTNIFQLAGHGQGAARVFQSFERSLNADHHVAIELHLLADVPVERAGNGFLDLLRNPVERASGARIDGADGSHLGLRCIAGMQQRHEVGQRQRAAGFRMQRAHPILNFLQNRR